MQDRKTKLKTTGRYWYLFSYRIGKQNSKLGTGTFSVTGSEKQNSKLGTGTYSVTGSENKVQNWTDLNCAGEAGTRAGQGGHTWGPSRIAQVPAY